MRWRPFHLALILFQAFWLNVVVPGHTRGAVVLPGHEAPCCAGDVQSTDDCCATTSAARRHHDPTPADRAHCAICFFAAHLTLPPPFDYSLAPLGPCARLALPAPQAEPSLPFREAVYCRGPPAGSLPTV